MTKSVYKPYWLVLLQVTGWMALAALGVTLLVAATLVWAWFPVAVVVVFFLMIVAFVVWVEQEDAK